MTAVERELDVVRMRLDRASIDATYAPGAFAIRFPAAAALMLRIALLAPPSWRVRQAVLCDAIRKGAEAHNRGDYEALRPGYHRDLELISEPEAVSLGFDPV
jgi:hypothetical protein